MKNKLGDIFVDEENENILYYVCSIGKKGVILSRKLPKDESDFGVFVTNDSLKKNYRRMDPTHPLYRKEVFVRGMSGLSYSKEIFLGMTMDGKVCICVHINDETAFLDGKPAGTHYWPHYKEVEEPEKNGMYDMYSSDISLFGFVISLPGKAAGQIDTKQQTKASKKEEASQKETKMPGTTLTEKDGLTPSIFMNIIIAANKAPEIQRLAFVSFMNHYKFASFKAIPNEWKKIFTSDLYNLILNQIGIIHPNNILKKYICKQICYEQECGNDSREMTELMTFCLEPPRDIKIFSDISYPVLGIFANLSKKDKYHIHNILSESLRIYK
jgi:hypothetical protein